MFLDNFPRLIKVPRLNWNATGQLCCIDTELSVAFVSAYAGFHEFAEFVTEDVGTLDSGLNSVVLANNNEFVLLPVNEPTFGTPRKSQIQTYLEQNEGPGLQHLALKTDDIFHTLG